MIRSCLPHRHSLRSTKNLKIELMNDGLPNSEKLVLVCSSSIQPVINQIMQGRLISARMIDTGGNSHVDDPQA
jgi:hypothetical protein